MNPSVCFVPSDFDGPGGYRCLLPAQELARRGWKVGIPRTQARKKDSGEIHFTIHGLDWKPKANPDADIYFIHRRLEQIFHDGVPSLQAQGKVVIASTDDNDLALPTWHPARGEKGAALRRYWHKTIGLCDALVVSTPHLAKAYRKHNRNVFVIPNYLDWNMWEEVTPVYEAKSWERLRVGWMGDPKLRRGDLEVLSRFLGGWLHRNPQVDFVSAGSERTHDLLNVPEAQRVTYPGVSFHSGKLPEITATMDIGLIPLELNSFNEAKSHLKGMEYAASGIPALASPSRSYRDWLGDGGIGFAVRSPKDWVEALDRLVADRDLRRRMGHAARAKARRHSLDKNIHEWEDLFRSFVGDRPHDRETDPLASLGLNPSLAA